jgi:hypothetical protein
MTELERIGLPQEEPPTLKMVITAKESVTILQNGDY